jgi:hypothetical protein
VVVGTFTTSEDILDGVVQVVAKARDRNTEAKQVLAQMICRYTSLMAMSRREIQQRCCVLSRQCEGIDPPLANSAPGLGRTVCSLQ